MAGGAVAGDVPQIVPMVSLDNVFGAEQLAEWAASVDAASAARRVWSPSSTAWPSPRAISAHEAPVLKPPTTHPGVRTNPTERR
ncbi:hypothetical protein [Nonomuraea dietziae]|uniref:hypothetical protein n=1 Tax=Nonomuraea dietziae TaxID=65515 RepID=UPI0031D02D8B